MPFSLTDSQKAKVVSALFPLFRDPEFDNVDNFNVLATEKITTVAGTDNVDVKPAPTV